MREGGPDCLITSQGVNERRCAFTRMELVKKADLGRHASAPTIRAAKMLEQMSALT